MTAGLRFTVDTNILIYAVDRSASEFKRERSIELLDRASSEVQPLSVQSLNEFCHAATRKRLLPQPVLRDFVARYSRALQIIVPGRDEMNAALDLHYATSYSYWDFLLLATAAKSACRIFFSEDMQDGFNLGTMQIVNPFQRSAREVASLLLSSS